MRLSLQERDPRRAREIGMRTPLLTLIAAVGLVAFEGTNGRAAAQQPPAPAVQGSSSSAPSGAVGHQPEVIITGDRAEFESKISAFVNQLTDFDYGDSNRGLARWQDPVCPLVTGLPQGMAEYILLRVSEVAREAGVPLAGEKCHHPNLFIIVTKQPEAYLREYEKLHGAAVFGGAAPILINEFMTTPRPVRTWYETVERTPEGLPMLAESFPGISQQKVSWVPGGLVVTPVRPAINDATLTNPTSEASHLVLNVVWAIKKVYVIVDPTRFKGVKLGQLADYVSMAGLAQIKLDPQLAGDPTILTLFDKDPQAASAGLTEWDRAFLKSFYSSEQRSVLQRSLISHDMAREIAP
jgi:hypothetical protein